MFNEDSDLWNYGTKDQWTKKGILKEGFFNLLPKDFSKKAPIILYFVIAYILYNTVWIHFIIENLENMFRPTIFQFISRNEQPLHREHFSTTEMVSSD